jgi:hypothetical protein
MCVYGMIIVVKYLMIDRDIYLLEQLVICSLILLFLYFTQQKGFYIYLYFMVIKIQFIL